MRILKILLLLAVSTILFLNCGGGGDDPVVPENPKPPEASTPPPDPQPPASSTIDELTLAINNFIWKGMNLWYLWVDEVPALDLNTYNDSQTELNAFLDDYNEPEDLFYDLLYDELDRFSWIVEDYDELENSFAGVVRSTGMEFGFYYESTYGKDIEGYIRYVIPGSSAANAGVKRGDIFTKINGIDLTDANYKDLLFGNATTYIITFLDGNKSISITDIDENPVLATKVIDTAGNKIGYICYNSFIYDYNVELNNALGELKNAGVNEFVLDLRYNGGGRISSAQLLASSIAGESHVGDIFSRSRYNDFINEKLIATFGNELLIDRFVDTLSDNSAPINFLSLNRVFVLVSGATASASELVINSLEPYMEVVLIGGTTYGKNVGSLTLYDSDDFSQKGTNINSNHKWAMQVVVVKIANANGFSDFTSGFPADIEANELEDYLFIHNTLPPLGDPNDPLLSKAIEQIVGGGNTSTTGILNDREVNLQLGQQAKAFMSSSDSRQFSKEMLLTVEELPFKFKRINLEK